MKLLIGIVLLAFTLTAFGQQEWADSSFTNKAEAKNLMVNGLKDGKWIEYFGEKMELRLKRIRKAQKHILLLYTKQVGSVDHDNFIWMEN